MDLNELLRVLWQRKLIMVATTLVVLALGFASLQIQTPVYEATSTVALTPGTGTTDPIFIISQIDVITPLYAEAVKTRDTQLLAKSLQKGRDVGELTVRTFSGAPIIKIDVRSPSPAAARSGAQAVTDALLLRAQRGEIGLTDTLALSQIDRPSLPTDPVKPLPKLTMLISLVLGLGSGVAAAVLWDRLGRKIDTIDELAAAAGVPCFGEVPTERAISGLRSPNELVNDPQYRIVAEALRDIRTNLQFTNATFRSILVTSPEGRHGKTFLAFGLAATLARSGARTLLADGDLRHGRVAEMLEIPREPGVMDVLRGRPLAESLQKTGLDALQLLPGGRIEDDPGELLESSFFHTLYELEAAFDVVVVDGTPLVPVNDARLMARYVSCVLLVVSAGTSTRRQVRTAVDRLSIIGVQVTAVVLNNFQCAAGPATTGTCARPGRTDLAGQRMRRPAPRRSSERPCCHRRSGPASGGAGRRSRAFHVAFRSDGTSSAAAANPAAASRHRPAANDVSARRRCSWGDGRPGDARRRPARRGGGRPGRRVAAPRPRRRPSPWCRPTGPRPSGTRPAVGADGGFPPRRRRPASRTPNPRRGAGRWRTARSPPGGGSREHRHRRNEGAPARGWPGAGGCGPGSDRRDASSGGRCRS